MSTKEALHRLIEELPDEQAERLLRSIEDPVERALALAPIDDEPLTPEDEAALQDGREALARGDILSTEELRRELGI